ncbi:sugar ABC transporter permease [Vallitalea pronyensis]|uniref:Sugar ABC transporter permease n=1 Tax=Vallitalea pronyensis TaxID=1348613 RepID=A0A8J8MNI6_9FIRM|nr:sugar ABC transporter permease [Vallitalea pronyensis]QUI24458.1 sugar ABC transporter permease [Vallitalea pronyensis]
MKKSAIKRNVEAYMFILPSLVGFIGFMIYPIVYSFVISLMKWNMVKGFNASKFIGFNNYLKAIKNDYFIEGIFNNFKFSLMAVPLLIILSLLIAVLLNKEIYGRSMLRTMYFMPYVATVTAAAVVFSVLFHPVFGPVNGFLRFIGIKDLPQWIASSKYALPTIALFWVWKQLGYCIVIYLAGLQGIPKSYYEAASIDGASGFKKFWHITMPLVSPTTFFLVITSVIASLQLFPEVKIMTDGGPGTATVTAVYHIYRSGFEDYKMGYASAVAWLFFVIVTIVTLIQWVGQKKWVKY